MCTSILNSIVPINQYSGLQVLSNKLIVEDEYITELKMEVVATSKSHVLGKLSIPWRKNTLLLGDLPSDYYMS
jgi:5'-nucleotidase